MELKDIADLMLNLSDNINFYWNFYVFTVIGIISWLASLKANLGNLLKTLVTMAFLFFVALNINGLVTSYSLSAAMLLELKVVMSKATTIHTEDIKKFIQGFSLNIHVYIVWITHIVVDICVLLFIWSNKLRNDLAVKT